MSPRFTVSLLLSLLALALPWPSAGQYDGDEEARLMLQQGRSLAAEGRPQEALPFLQHALDMAEARLDASTPALAFLVHEVGTVYRAAGQMDRAEGHLRRAVQLLGEIFGADHAELAGPLGDLASLFAGSGRYQEAEEAYGRLLAVLRSSHRPGDPERVAVVTQLAWLADSQGRTSEAANLYRQAIDGAAVDRQDSPELATALNNLAALELRRGDLDAAAGAYRRALGLRQRLLGPRHWLVAVTTKDLASIEARAGRLRQATRLAAEAEAILAGPCADAATAAAAELCREVRQLRADLDRRLADTDPAPAPTPQRPARAATGPAGADARTQARATAAFRSQLAARSDGDAARRELRQLRARFPGLLGELPARVDAVDLGERGVWHRVQFGAFASKAAARRLCDALLEAGLEDCWVVAPERPATGG